MGRSLCGALCLLIFVFLKVNLGDDGLLFARKSRHQGICFVKPLSTYVEKYLTEVSEGCCCLQIEYLFSV